jgi:hypothetical protein
MRHTLKYILLFSLLSSFSWYNASHSPQSTNTSKGNTASFLLMTNQTTASKLPSVHELPLELQIFHKLHNRMVSSESVISHSQLSPNHINLLATASASGYNLETSITQGNDNHGISTSNFPIIASLHSSPIDELPSKAGNNNITSAAVVVYLPVFVKLHVVGSSTLVNLLRCIVHSKEEGSSSSSKNTHVLFGKIGKKGVSLGQSYWNARQCGQEQGHETIAAFAQGGTSSLLCCVDESSLSSTTSGSIPPINTPPLQLSYHVNIKLVTLLRHPIEKYISSIYTFVNGGIAQTLHATLPANITSELLGKHYQYALFCTHFI